MELLLFFFLLLSVVFGQTIQTNCTTTPVGYLCCPGENYYSRPIVVNYLVDPNHCGACSVVCPSSRAVCCSGVCISDAGAPYLSSPICPGGPPVLNFPGEDPYTSIIYQIPLNNKPSTPSDFSIAVWVKFTSVNPTPTGNGFFSFGDHCNSGGSDFALGHDPNVNTLFATSCGNFNATVPYVQNSFWNLVIVTLSHSQNTVTIYLNGTLQRSSATVTFSQFLPSHFRLGRRLIVFDTTGNSIPCQLANIGIWNRLLSTCEVDFIFNTGNYPTNFLLAFFKGNIVNGELQDTLNINSGGHIGDAVTNVAGPSCLTRTTNDRFDSELQLETCPTCVLHDVCCPNGNKCTARNLC